MSKGPIRVYWDIENISPGKRGVERFFEELCNKLRQLFDDAYTPPLITIVCNVLKTDQKMLKFLFKNRVDIKHIIGEKSEEADRKIEETVRHDLTYSPESNFVLISHDNDFVGILREMQHRSSKESKIVYVRRSQTGGRCTAALARCVDHPIKMASGSRSSSPVSSDSNFSPTPSRINVIVIKRAAIPPVTITKRVSYNSVVVTRSAVRV